MKNIARKLLVGMLLVGTATKSNESVNANYNLEKLIFNPEPVKIELMDSLKVEMPKIKPPKVEQVKYDESRRLDKETLNEFINFIYSSIKVSETVDKKFVKSIIDAESERYVYAKSKVGARGLMQLMPDTWNIMETESDFYKEAFNPYTNLRAGIKYLNWIDNYCEKNHPKWEELSTKEKSSLIAAAYNGGINRLRNRNWDINKMPEQTRLYVKKIEKINP